MARREQFRARRTNVLLAVLAIAGGLLVVAGPSSADVTEVKGSAFGYATENIIFFGGPQPAQGPAPTVTLPAGGSADPVTATEPSSSVMYFIATVFSSDTLAVSTEGTPGGGSVTSSSTIENVNASGQESFTADSIESTCTADETGVTASTTVAPGATVLTDNGDATHPEVTVEVPTDPAPNTAIEGVLRIGTSIDTFTYVFNEQTTNADGSITVYAFHQSLKGPLVTGDLLVGKSECGVTATTTTTTSSTTPGSTTTSSTTPGGSTTTSSTTPGGSTTTSSTTIPSITVVTVGGGGDGGGGGGRGPLSRTGTNSRRMAGLGMLAMVLGICAVRAARYRRYAAPWER